TLEQVGPGHLIRSLGATPGVRYIAIQDTDGILAASTDLPTLPVLRDDPELASLDDDRHLVTHEIETDMGRVFEVARRIRLAEGGPVVLRIGLDSASLDHAREALRLRTWMRTGILIVMIGLAAALLLAWQRHEILDREVAAVRTELRAREQEALQAQKLVAMGELASGVAHEIRNPLNTIHMIAQQLEREPDLDSELRTQVGHVTSESRRIEGIVQQFLTFARPRRPQLETLDLAEIARKTAQAADAAYAAAGVRLTVQTESIKTALDRGFVTEIIENLLRNAREASAAGGEVGLSIERVGSDAILAVEDEGPGVPADVRQRIFDLYFTTKPEGSGVGLALVAQMAASMGGGVRLDETTPRGARFVVHFPVRKEPG
ncbi:MAG: hypothetical protein KC729_20765, partial [Candidatus Eisenbacteria bacterium]|nr:hypothetical protein [Candidatus Eisenbacteria bacterium]